MDDRISLIYHSWLPADSASVNYLLLQTLLLRDLQLYRPLEYPPIPVYFCNDIEVGIGALERKTWLVVEYSKIPNMWSHASSTKTSFIHNTITSSQSQYPPHYVNTLKNSHILTNIMSFDTFQILIRSNLACQFIHSQKRAKIDWDVKVFNFIANHWVHSAFMHSNFHQVKKNIFQ